MRLLLPLALVPLLSASLCAQAPFAKIAANDNRIPAGTLENGVLELKLDIVRAMWFPDRDTDPGIDVYAFAEAGHAPSIPAPLIRVPAGTEIRTTIHNTQSDSSFLVFGLSGDRTMRDTVRIQPGETRELIAHAPSAGTFVYGAMVRLLKVRDGDPRVGDDHMATGAFIVDEPGRRVNDRVLVLLQWLNPARLKGTETETGEILSINGKSWPNTERLDYQLGDTIRWRVVNGSLDVHPMHLHGAYFTVNSRSAGNRDTIYSTDERRLVVTERLLPLTTMSVQWVPVHAGNWVFHCHLTPHIMPHAQLAAMKASDDHAEPMSHMSGLVMGIRVHGEVAADPPPQHRMRLLVQQFASPPGVPPRMSYTLDHEAMTAHAPGPLITLTRDETTAITVVNRAPQPTSVHWHGLEIESYFDGVHGFGGDAHRIAPEIAPGDSFIVKLTPPRAGTFIYHTHLNELFQQIGGLYGPLVVLEPGQKWDAEHERLIVLGAGLDTLENIYVNGEEHPTWQVKAGQTYRIRLINIHITRPSIIVTVKDGDAIAEWNLIARDGADLPRSQAGLRPFQVQPTTGQTFDGLFTPRAGGKYQLVITTGAGQVLNTGDIVVEK